jgi:DNA-binding PadR family transcriptional regulator
MSSTADSLDWKSIEILQALAGAGTSLTTTEVREATDLGKNRIILYRISEYLEPQGLVSTHQPEATGTVVPAKEISLTDAGTELTTALDSPDDHGLTLTDLPEKVYQLSERLDKTQTEIERLHSQGQSADEVSLENLSERVETQQEQLAQLAHTVAMFETQSQGAWSEEQQEEFHRLRLGMYAMRDYLFDNTDLDPDRLDEYTANTTISTP